MTDLQQQMAEARIAAKAALEAGDLDKWLELSRELGRLLDQFQREQGAGVPLRWITVGYRTEDQ